MESTITEEREGVQLQKSVAESEFDQPAVVYEFTSLRVEPVTVTLVERLPESVDPMERGLDVPEGGDHWAVTDGELRFEYELDGDAQYRTVCTVETDAPVETADLLGEPDAFTVDPSVEMVRGGSASECSDLADAEEETASTAEAPSSPADGAPSSPGNATGHRTPDSVPDISRLRTQGGETPEHGAGPDTSVLDTLVTELKADGVSDETLAEFRAELDVEYQQRSVDARIKQLQTDFADLRAYTTALESFLDDHGSAEEMVSRFEDELDAFERELDDVAETVDIHSSVIGSHNGDIQEMQAHLDSMEADVASVESDVSDLSSTVEGLASELEGRDIDARFAEIEREIDEVAELQKQLKRVFQS